MNYSSCLIAACLATSPAFGADFGIASLERTGSLTVSNAFTNGVCSLAHGSAATGPWTPHANVFTTNSLASFQLGLSNSLGFFRAQALDLSNGGVGFTNLTESYSLLTTIAGAGGSSLAGSNKWVSTFENGPATSAQLSRPHIAM